MIELYGHGFSSNSRKVHWALEEANIEFDYVTVDLMQGEQKSPDFMEENPNGRLPVLVDGELSIYESNAILLYLADRFETHAGANKSLHRRIIDEDDLLTRIALNAGIGDIMGNRLQCRLGDQERLFSDGQCCLKSHLR